MEPLLLLLVRKLTGLVVSGRLLPNQQEEFRQISEAYCDDINLLVTNDADLNAIGNAVLKFEKASGAILSRNMKCLVLGLGSWSDRQYWVLDYLRPVKEIKVFGIWIMSSYPKLLSTNWNRRVDKFRKSVYSWTGRFFRSIKQKICVLSQIHEIVWARPVNYVKSQSLIIC